MSPAQHHKPVTFLVVDDHPVFRQGLVALIRSDERYRVSAEAGSAAGCLAALEKGLPDIALIGIAPDAGCELVKTLKATHPEVVVLVISVKDDVASAERALTAGARGYVMKQEAPAVMLEAIESVLAGKIYVSAVMRDRLFETVFGRPEKTAPAPVSRRRKPRPG
jgi:DNA-binding NarL/FixJ family response regulator